MITSVLSVILWTLVGAFWYKHFIPVFPRMDALWKIILLQILCGPGVWITVGIQTINTAIEQWLL